jgi:ribokinase
MGKIVVIGSSNTDMVVRTSKMPLPGETVMGNHFSVVPGGKGANQAVAAARAGADVSFMAKLGADDLGQKAIQGYQKDNINTSFILADRNYPSGVAMILVDETSGQNSIVVAPGANNRLSEQDIVENSSIMEEAGLLLIQLEIPLETVQKALESARKRNLRIILNPAPARELSDNLLKMVDIITPNESETQILTGIYPENQTQAKKAAELLLGKVNHSVVITMGEKGVYALSKDGEEIVVEGEKVNVKDTTAAGDVFNGYLADGINNGMSLQEALNRANKASAISVSREGAQPSIPFLNEL